VSLDHSQGRLVSPCRKDCRGPGLHIGISAGLSRLRRQLLWGAGRQFLLLYKVELCSEKEPGTTGVSKSHLWRWRVTQKLLWVCSQGDAQP
jgi:hypothetical protein